MYPLQQMNEDQFVHLVLICGCYSFQIVTVENDLLVSGQVDRKCVAAYSGIVWVIGYNVERILTFGKII